MKTKLPLIWTLSEIFSKDHPLFKYSTEHLVFFMYKENKWVEMIDIDIQNLFFNWIREKYPETYQAFPPRRVEEVLLLLKNISSFSLKKLKNQANENGLLIPFENGVLNIKTLQFYRHDPSHYNTHVLSLSYDKHAQIANTSFETYLKTCFNNAIKLNMIRACLYCIFTNNVKFQIALYLYGPGGTGKSTLVNIISYLLGPDVTFTTSFSNLSSRFGTANLSNKLLLIINDMSLYRGAEPRIIKEIISGDRIVSEKKYKDAFSFIPNIWLILTSNSIWEIKNPTTGISRRMIYYPFDNMPLTKDTSLFNVSEIDKNEYKATGTLVNHLNGFINWVLSCPLEYVESLRVGGETLTSLVNNNNLIETNPLLAWVDEWLISDPNAKGEPIGSLRSSAYSRASLIEKMEQKDLLNSDSKSRVSLFDSYSKWAVLNNIESISIHKFSISLKDLLNSLKWQNVEKKRTANGFILSDIRLRKESVIQTDLDVIAGKTKENNIALGKTDDPLDFIINLNRNNKDQQSFNLNNSSLHLALDHEHTSHEHTSMFNKKENYLALTPIVNIENLIKNLEFEYKFWVCLLLFISLIVLLSLVLYLFNSKNHKIWINKLKIEDPNPRVFSLKGSDLIGKEGDSSSRSIKIYKKIVSGFKKGLSVPLLPHKLDIFHNNIFTRIFRFLGGICVLITILDRNLNILNLIFMPLKFVILYYSLIFMVYFLFIQSVKIIFGFNTLAFNKEKFEVKNSPLSKFSSQLAYAIYCAKWGCMISGGTAAAIAAGNSFDSVLVAAGKEPLFIPFMGNILKQVFPGDKVFSNMSDKEAGKMIQSKIPENTTRRLWREKDITVSQLIAEYNSLSPADRLKFRNDLEEQIKNVKEK